MELIVLLLVLIIGLATFSETSLTWRPDTREQWPEDVNR